MSDLFDKLDAARRGWEAEVVAPAIQRTPERAASFETVSGRTVERVYVPAREHAEKYAENIGFPGQFPFTRGVQPTMYRGRLWTIRQYAGFGTAAESNRRYKYLIEQGTAGLSVAFDLPTQIGYDSDDSIALGEVGRVGVAIDTLADMETLFDGIPLDKISTSMTINATAIILLAMYIAVAEKQGVSPSKISGTVQNDILKEYIARGTYRFPPGPSLRLATDILAYSSRELPKWNPISISGYHIREAGATAGQELGFMLADAVGYIEHALKAGLSIDEFGPRLAYFFAVHTDVFEEAAKFRAARRLYARLMRDRFGAKSAQSCMLRFHTQTGGVTLTSQQPENNVVRVTLQALAAVLGGTQSLHTNSKDEALALPTEESVGLAVRTQHIIAHESGVTNTVDPLGGSYYVEALTDQLEKEASDYIRRIDELGGVVPAIEQGWIQRHIEQSAYRYGQSVERGQRLVVGINAFATENDPKIPTFRLNEDSVRGQTARLAEIRKKRDAGAVESLLRDIEAAARSTTNLMPPVLAAVKAYASVGEICRVLEKVFGVWRDPNR